MRTLVLAVSLIGWSAATAQSSDMSPRGKAPSTAGFGKDVQLGLERVRAATRYYVSLDSAVAAGYPREVRECLADAEHGGMGFHHVNRSYVDRALDVDHPEILLYEREPSGRYSLNGVEFIVPYRVWPKDSVPPTIMGLPLKRSDGLSLWYLHMWAWKENPSGLFADWNPTVHCEKS